MDRRPRSRRNFLARTGVLGAAASAGLFASSPRPASASVVPSPVELLRPVLAELSRDTFNGLVAFVVPGSDAYSRAQGTPRTEPGGLAVRTSDFVIETVDNYVPFPQEIARPVVAGLMTATSDLGIELPGPIEQLLPLQVRTLDEALRVILAAPPIKGETVPLSLVVSLLLNLPATQVNPIAVRGRFGSPFSRLSFEEKAATFALLESGDADLVGALDTSLPEPLRGSVSGLMRFLSGGLLEFAAFGAYNEWSVFDPSTGTLTERPLGWKLTRYDGVSDGWDDFLGYYQGRKKVSG